MGLSGSLRLPFHVLGDKEEMIACLTERVAFFRISVGGWVEKKAKEHKGLFNWEGCATFIKTGIICDIAAYHTINQNHRMIQ